MASRTSSPAPIQDDAARLGRDARPSLWAAAPRALALWTRRSWLVAGGVAAGVGVLIGISTVLIPNDWFRRDIATTAWDYPVWVIVSVLSGMLVATYVSPVGRRSLADGAGDAGSIGSPETAEGSGGTANRPARFGVVGAVLGWFAVGCPVCNKIALLALGYTGALQWFAPAQPFLAAAAIALSGAALLVRLRGQVWCPVPAVSAP